MSFLAIITFTIVAGIIWGGFIYLLFNAVENEKLK